MLIRKNQFYAKVTRYHNDGYLSYGTYGGEYKISHPYDRYSFLIVIEPGILIGSGQPTVMRFSISGGSKGGRWGDDKWSDQIKEWRVNIDGDSHDVYYDSEINKWVIDETFIGRDLYCPSNSHAAVAFEACKNFLIDNPLKPQQVDTRVISRSKVYVRPESPWTFLKKKLKRKK